MKDRRIWIVIGCILVIGTGVTHYTKYYVNSQGEAMMAETTAGAGEMTMAGSSLASVTDNETPYEEETAAGRMASEAPAERGMTGAPGTGAPDMAAAPEAGQGSLTEPGAAAAEGASEEALAAEAAARPEAADEAQAFAGEAIVEEAVPISPLTGARTREYKTALAVDYRKRLEDLDSQILRMREDETDSNVYSIKTSAETELRMWESELNSIYNALLEMQSQEDAARLAAEQQDWLKNRDARAAENSGKSSGNSMDGIGYAATLANLTRDRAYELAGRYEEANGVVLEENDILPASP